MKKMTRDLDEQITLDPHTGASIGGKLARFDLVPPDALWALAEHFGEGAKKHGARNWEKGYAWTAGANKLLRHLIAWLGGEDIDPQSARAASHLDAVLWHAITLRAMELRGTGVDDRSETAIAPHD